MPMYRKVNTKFFRKWSPNMAYVLGFFAADGNMIVTKRGTHFISFYSADKNLMSDIQSAMESEHLLAKRQKGDSPGYVYRFQIGSKEMFQDLQDLGFEPQKTKRMRIPAMPRKYFSDFVRGYFDGDGNVWSGITNKNRTNPSRILQAVFTSSCKEFLEDLQNRLQQEGLGRGSLRTHAVKNFSRLGYGSHDSLKLSSLMYNADTELFLARKRLRFEQFKKLRS